MLSISVEVRAFGGHNARFRASNAGMSTYELHYAKEHLFELFDAARSGEEVIIVRADGRSCELTPLAEVKQDEPTGARFKIPDEAPGTGELVPA
jgi:antitoxin (DNA-binding transcriptional repressor) of toxin-antitoxin stability system